MDSGTQTDISFESRLGGGEPPQPPHDYYDPVDLGEPERPEELEYEEVELYKASHRDKLGLTVCYRTDGEEDAGIYVGEVNPNSIAAKDGRIREGDRIIQINGVEVQDREEAVAFLTREQQTNISLLLARPDSQRWKDSDREDFLDDFGSDEEGELQQRGGAWTPPGQAPSPSPPCPRGAEPDSGVGRTDESTRNEESSEHDLLGDDPATPGPEPDSGLETDPESDLDQEPEPEPDSEPDRRVQWGRREDPELERDPEPDSEQEPEPELGLDPDPELDSDLDSDPDHGVEREDPELDRREDPELERAVRP